VPARTPVYFQLLDARGRMVQTMRSWSTLQPGESAACVGCHETKNSAPLAGVASTVALRKGAEELRPFYGPPRGFSFAREVQPILDAKCVRCHDGPQGKPPDLSGRGVEDVQARRRWSEAYLSLTQARTDEAKRKGAWRGKPEGPLVTWISSQSAPPMLPPNAAGAGRSKLLAILDKGHEGVIMTREEMDKLAAWIDLGVPFCGDYVEANAWTDEEKAKYARFAAKRRRLEAIERSNIEALLGEPPGSVVRTEANAAGR
jgi:hypothetical protein